MLRTFRPESPPMISPRQKNCPRCGQAISVWRRAGRRKMLVRRTPPRRLGGRTGRRLPLSEMPHRRNRRAQWQRGCNDDEAARDDELTGDGPPPSRRLTAQPAHGGNSSPSFRAPDHPQHSRRSDGLSRRDGSGPIPSRPRKPAENRALAPSPRSFPCLHSPAPNSFALPPFFSPLPCSTQLPSKPRALAASNRAFISLLAHGRFAGKLLA